MLSTAIPEFSLDGDDPLELCLPSSLRCMCVRTRLHRPSGTRLRGQVKISIVTEILIGIGFGGNEAWGGLTGSWDTYKLRQGTTKLENYLRVARLAHGIHQTRPPETNNGVPCSTAAAAKSIRGRLRRSTQDIVATFWRSKIRQTKR